MCYYGVIPRSVRQQGPAAAAVETVRWPPRQPAGGLSKGDTTCVVGVQVVNHVQGGHVLVPPMDGGGGTGL